MRTVSLCTFVCLCIASASTGYADDQSEADGWSMSAAMNVMNAQSTLGMLNLNFPEYGHFKTDPYLTAEKQAQAAQIEIWLDFTTFAMFSEAGAAVADIASAQVEYGDGFVAYNTGEYLAASSHWGLAFSRANESVGHAVSAMIARDNGMMLIEQMYSLYILQP